MELTIQTASLWTLALAYGLAHAASPADSGAANVAGEATHAARIAAVESGLKPAVLVKGEPRPNWSLAERMAYYNVPGVSIAIIVDGKIAWTKGYGVLDAEKPDKVDTRTLFQAASISKPVTAVAALRLVEQGKLDLDGPVNARLERWKIPENEYTKQRAVTLRHLLSHRAGTTVSGFPGYAKGTPLPTLIQVLNGESPANTPPVVVDKVPGESMRYSGGGTTIVQLLIEDVTNASFADYMEAHVLQSLGMKRSHFRHPIHDENAARAHTGDEAVPVSGHDHIYPELAAAGMWTTPSDLATFALEVVDALRRDKGAHISAVTARDMLAPQGANYALGFDIIKADDGLAFGHDGANHGFRCRLLVYNDGRGGFAVMTNSDNGAPLIREIGAAVADAYGWRLYAAREREAITLSATAMRAIAGAYYVDPKDEHAAIKITVEQGVMWIDAPFVKHARLYAASEKQLFANTGHQYEVENDAEGRPNAILMRNGQRAVRR